MFAVLYLKWPSYAYADLGQNDEMSYQQMKRKHCCVQKPASASVSPHPSSWRRRLLGSSSELRPGRRPSLAGPGLRSGYTRPGQQSGTSSCGNCGPPSPEDGY